MGKKAQTGIDVAGVRLTKYQFYLQPKTNRPNGSGGRAEHFSSI